MSDNNKYMSLVNGEWIIEEAPEWANVSDAPSVPHRVKLSDILDNPADPKYGVSPRACRGILRRMYKRDKLINNPPEFLMALKIRAMQPDQAQCRADESAEEMAMMDEIYRIIDERYKLWKGLEQKK